MSFKKSFLLSGLSAMLLAAPAAAAQTSPDLTSQLLIAILVKKGVLSRADADSILREATQEAAVAATSAPTTVPAPASSGNMSASSTEPDGTIHVTYVPKIVREQIAQEVTQQVLSQETSRGYAAPNQIPDWLHRIRIYGDFRSRYESDLFPRGNDNTGAFPNFNAINTGSPYDISSANQNFPSQINDDQNRNRFRIRARLGVAADLGDGFNVDFRLATGENDSPVSENQTLGGAPSGGQGGDFSKYAIWVDRADMTYSPPLGPDAKVTFSVGRFDNPFFSTNLIFADDLGFDGFAATGSYKFDSVAPFIDSISPFITGGAFPIYNTDFNFASNQPSKFPSHDKWLFGAQIGVALNVLETLAVKIGAADYYYSNISGKLSAPCTVLSAADSCSTDDDRPSFAQNGNTYMALRDIIPTAANGNGTTSQYQYFGLASAFDELAVTGRVDDDVFGPNHLWTDGEYVYNARFNRADIAAKAVNNRGPQTATSATGNFAGGNTGYFISGSVGHPELQQQWDWNASLGYKYLQSDAVVDGLTDSDFGLGGTNLKGYIAAASLALNPRVWVRMRYLSADAIIGPTYRADVFQIDLNGKF